MVMNIQNLPTVSYRFSIPETITEDAREPFFNRKHLIDWNVVPQSESRPYKRMSIGFYNTRHVP